MRDELATQAHRLGVDHPLALAEAINALLASSELCQRMGAAGRRRVEAEFTVDPMVERYEGLYREVVAAG